MIRVFDVGNRSAFLSATVPREGMPQTWPEGWRHTILLSETNQSLQSWAVVTMYM
jgi:hypothetical protein